MIKPATIDISLMFNTGIASCIQSDWSSFKGETDFNIKIELQSCDQCNATIKNHARL